MSAHADDDGASPREQLIEACRRNNTHLLQTLLTTPPLSTSAPASVAAFLNGARDALGAPALHVAAARGSYEVLDVLLDQEGVEIDGTEPRDGDTCLHRAVRYANGLDKADWPHGRAVVDILLDAGCDPRIRNKAKLKPIDLVDPRHTELRNELRKAEITLIATQDAVEEEDDGGHDGPGSESD